LARRLVVVQAKVRDVLDQVATGSVRAISIGAGQGHDLIGVLAPRTRVSQAVIARDPPSRLLRLFFKAPVVLYRLRMGWLLGSRFLLLTHTGRRTGQTRLTVIEVVGYDPSIPEAVVIAAWGERAQWVRNLKAAPAVSVQIGRVHWSAPEHRILDPERAAEVIATYWREHPVAARMIAKLLGWPPTSTGVAYEQFVQTLCAVAFRPSRKGN